MLQAITECSRTGDGNLLDLAVKVRFFQMVDFK